MLGQICSELPLVLGKALYFHHSFLQFTYDLAKSCDRKKRNVFIILYADDILLLAPSITCLEYVNES